MTSSRTIVGGRIAGGAIAGCALAAGDPARAQHLATGGSVDVSIVRIVAALVFSLLVGLGLVMARRRYPGQVGAQRIKAVLAGLKAEGLKTGGLAARLVAPRRIDVIEARRLSAHADICLVRCDDEEFLVLAGAGGMTVLKTMPAAQAEAGAA